MKIVIIGNGIAGTNAARFIRKRSDHQITMISDESWQPFSRTALMYIYMGHLKQEHTYLYEDWFWAKNRILRILARVQRIDVGAKKVALDNGVSLDYDKLIIATGSVSNKFGWPGEDLEGVRGLYHLQDLQVLEQYSQGLNRAVIVGGGLIGIEMAEMFRSRQIPVTFLVREKSFWDGVLPPEESAMVNREIRSHGIDLRLETELKEIAGDGTGQVRSVKTGKDERIDCGFVGLTAGVSPNVGFLRDSGIALNKGILVDQYLNTSEADVYAVGDCAELREPGPGRKAIEAIWYTGRMMGQTVAASICGEKTAYRPRLWFNSAKFFDIEYQVYGDVPAKRTDEISTLYWEHPDGKKSIRINYETASQAVTGFNLMGVRYRHEVCEKWIIERTSIGAVLRNLSLANFDPEFYDQYERQVLQAFSPGTRLLSERETSLVTGFLKQAPGAQEAQTPGR